MEEALDTMTDLLATATAAATALATATATAAAEDEGWLPSPDTNSSLPLGMDGNDVAQPGGSYILVSGARGWAGGACVMVEAASL